MIKLFHKLFKSSFAKSVLMISGGTALAQVLNAGFSPIITRLYTPDQYGVLTVFTALLASIGVIGSLNIEFAIPISDDDEKAVNIVFLSIVILIFITGILSFVLFLFGEPFLELINSQVLSDYMYLIPLGVFFTGLYKIFMQWAFRNKNYKGISKTKVLQSVIQNIVNVGLGFLGIGSIGLITGRVLGESFGITPLSRDLFKEKKYLLKKINKNTMIWALKRYKRFIYYLAPTQLIAVLSTKIPVFFISSIYAGDVRGYFGLANSIVNLPMTLIGQSVGDVFYSEIASFRNNPRRAKELSNKLLRKLFLVGLIPLITLELFGPWLFSFVFGSNWYEAGIYSRFIAVMDFSILIFTPISRVYEVFERQRIKFLFTILKLIIVLFSFYLTINFNLNPLYSIAIYSFGMSIYYFFNYLLANKILNDEINKNSE